MDIISEFLQAEIYPNGMYEEIILFITSPHIRSGEFEGNEYIIKKMDQANFLIFLEYTYDDGKREIHFAISVYRENLIQAINDYAHSRGIQIKCS